MTTDLMIAAPDGADTRAVEDDVTEDLAEDLAEDEVFVPDHPAWADAGMPPTGELIRSMAEHFAARAVLENDASLGLVAVILDEAPLGVAARVAAILWDIETAEIDPLGVVERIVRDAIIAAHVAEQAGGAR